MKKEKSTALAPNFYRKTLLGLLACLAYLVGSCTPEQDNQERPPIDRVETDELMIKHKDSLKHYFSTIEIDLIRQYKVNHENLKSTQDFYIFYRNANTLRKTLKKRLNRRATAQELSQLHPIPWFEEIAKGMEVLRTPDQKHYGVYFDYDDLLEHAEQTEGAGDDYFIRFLRTAYFDHSDNPKWLNIVDLSTGNFCSQLGTGTHVEILEASDKALSASATFHKEVQKTKVQVLSDIVFNRRYCTSKGEVIREIDLILEKVDLKEKERDMLEKRRDQIQENVSEGILFNCSSGDCIITTKS